jgi:hypothetical protein
VTHTGGGQGDEADGRMDRPVCSLLSPLASVSTIHCPLIGGRFVPAPCVFYCRRLCVRVSMRIWK